MIPPFITRDTRTVGIGTAIESTGPVPGPHSRHATAFVEVISAMEPGHRPGEGDQRQEMSSHGSEQERVSRASGIKRQCAWHSDLLPVPGPALTGPVKGYVRVRA